MKRRWDELGRTMGAASTMWGWLSDWHTGWAGGGGQSAQHVNNFWAPGPVSRGRQITYMNCFPKRNTYTNRFV